MSCTAPCPGLEILDQRAFIDHPDKWDDLLLRSYDNRFFLTSIWQRAWWDHFGNGDSRVIASSDDAGVFQALVPLQVTENAGQQVLSLIGDPNVTDYMDALAERRQALALLTDIWGCALEDIVWDRVELRHVPSGSPLLPALRTAAERRSLAVSIEDDEVCPVAILCSSWEGYLQMLSKKQRHEIRRKLRRAQEGVEWEWRTVKTQEELDRDLPIFFRLHEASAREKARFMTHEMRRYFAAMASTMLAAGFLRLSVFNRDGLDIAATMSFLYRDRYLLYNSGYDPEYAAYSPGIAAVAHAMQDAIEEKAIAFDFLSGDESYKYQLGAGNTHTARATVTRY